MNLWARLVRSLKHRDFRLYFSAQAVSILGTWMQNVAQAWLVYRLTGSSLMLGLTSFFALTPVLIGGLYGGALADRVSRYRLSLYSHYAAMILAFTLGVLTLGGWVRVWHVMLLAFCLGTTHAIGTPARHAFIAEIVPRSDLPNAIALHSTAFNAARFIGPVLAGWAMLLGNEGWVFVFNGITYVFFILSMWRMNHPAQPTTGKTSGSFPADVFEALRHSWHQPHIRAVLLMVGLAGLVGTPYLTLMPVLTDHVFHGGAETLGILLGAAGVGSMVGALFLAQRTGHEGLTRFIAIMGLTGGTSLFVFSRVEELWLGLLTLPLVGFSMTSLIASANTLVQLLVPDAIRGRVVSVFSVVFLGLSPLGNLGAGALAEVLGASKTVSAFGLALTVASLGYLAKTPTKQTEGKSQGQEAAGSNAKRPELTTPASRSHRLPEK